MTASIKIATTIVILVTLISCKSSLKSHVGKKSSNSDVPSQFIVNFRSPFVVRAGEIVEIRGMGFTGDLKISLGSSPVGAIELIDDSTAYWRPSAQLSAGFHRLTATQGESSQSMTILYQPGEGTIPVITADASAICSDLQYFDAKGALQTGTKNCGSSATLPKADQVCHNVNFGDDTGTAICQSGIAAGVNPAPSEMLVGRSAWLSDGSLINGSLIDRKGSWNLSGSWPGAGVYDSAPSFALNKICSDTTLLGSTGTANCGAYKGNAVSSAHRTVNANQSTLISETSAGLGAGYRKIPNILTDDDGYHGSSPVIKQSRPTSDCGTSGSVEVRISDCNTSWIGKEKGTAGEGDWKLVSRLTTNVPSAGSIYEVWRDERTGLLWSDRVGDIGNSINPDTDDFTANWCQASGNAQSDDPSGYCNSATYQNQTTAQSWCTAEATGAQMKGNLGVAQNVSWRLPTKYDWHIADANGIRFVLPNMANWYWSATVASHSRDSAWQFVGGDGSINLDSTLRDRENSVRCVGAF